MRFEKYYPRFGELQELSAGMKTLFAVLFLIVAGTTWGQNDLPLQFKGTCDGTQTDIRDLSAVQNTPAVKCDALVIAQMNGHTVLSFSNGDPSNPVLLFSGDLITVNTSLPFDPYIGPLSTAFPIDRVLWGDGTPAVSVHAGEHSDKFDGRGCYFHFIDKGWGQLGMVECELIVEGPNHRPRRVTVTFTPERKFTVDGREISVKYGVRGANSFYALFNGMKIDGTCKVWLYQIDGALKHVQPGTPIADLFKTVCYKDAAALQ
ncbi:hypothetical protein [Granulicella sp. L46]|uniref:hypothetical protein n=1 Tax=Granulicella sp. L46 TaxID=1641865 RepID=UPI00131B4A0A|nr:hypothetical protein [Granulicella sp. L46]